MAADDALVVPTIFDADRKSLGEIGRDARALASRVRDGSMTPPQVSGATFTVSNLGMYGVDSFSAVINPPQAAILAVGALQAPAARRRRLGRAGGASDDHAVAGLRSPDRLRSRRRSLPHPGARAARAPTRPAALSTEMLGGGLGLGGRLARRRGPVGARVGGAQPVVHLDVLGRQLEPGGSRLELEQRGEVDVVAADRDQPLDDLLGGRRLAASGRPARAAASKPRWKSLSSSDGVNVGLKSRLT